MRTARPPPKLPGGSKTWATRTSGTLRPGMRVGARPATISLARKASAAARVHSLGPIHIASFALGAPGRLLSRARRSHRRSPSRFGAAAFLLDDVPGSRRRYALPRKLVSTVGEKSAAVFAGEVLDHVDHSRHRRLGRQ